MATPATARRSEPRSTMLEIDTHLPPSSPPSTHPPPSRASTPRPSISPLSTASKPNKSPATTRDTLTTDAETSEYAQILIARDPLGPEIDDDRDDRSSSLSEPEDEPDEEPHNNRVLRGIERGVELVTQPSLDADSEAETERLEATPRKLRQHAESVGRTPSKLIHSATAEDDLSEPPSPLLVGAGAAPGTANIASVAEPKETFPTIPFGAATDATIPAMKRKRSGSDESSLTSAASDLEESPRKRSHEKMTSSKEALVAIPNGMAKATVEGMVDVVALLEEQQSTPMPTMPKGIKGKKGKQKGKRSKDVVAETPAEQIGTLEPEHAQELGEETAAKVKEQRQHKAEASSLFEEVARQFTAFRDRLYKERLAGVEAELALLSEPACQHPEYLRHVACVNARRDKQVREANAYYYYRLNATRQRTLGDRSLHHSQYFQHVRQLREDVLYELGEDWYNIQKERRQQHQEQDDAYIYKFPSKKSVQIRQQAKYNQEVSVLSGVAKYVGFPAAPEIIGAEGESMEDDLKAMKIPRRVHQPAAVPATTAAQHRQVLYPSIPTVSAQNERLAHEQFIERNAWAQPQRPIHTHGTPNLTHTPDWAEPGAHTSTRNLLRNISGQVQLHRTNSPYTTPMPHKRSQQSEQHFSSSGTVAVNSDGVEVPSSVLAAPPTFDRLQQLQQHVNSNQGSPLVVNKHRHQNGNGNGNGVTELTGFRNVSNMSATSGASTIDALPDSAEKASRIEQHVRHEQPARYDQHMRNDQHVRHELHRTEPPTGKAVFHQPKSLPALLSEASAPPPLPHQLGFDVHQRQLLRHSHGDGAEGVGRREALANMGVGVGFRAQEGAPFGNPAPLQAAGMGGAP